MALDKMTLGADLYDRAQSFNDVDIAPEDLEQARFDFWVAIAEGIIEHFKANGELTVPGAGLMAGTTAVTGSSVTGKIS